MSIHQQNAIAVHEAERLHDNLRKCQTFAEAMEYFKAAAHILGHVAMLRHVQGAFAAYITPPEPPQKVEHGPVCDNRPDQRAAD